jgi:nucleotidyltransferase substrate binding protein (TIGR01987 family)
MENPKEIRWKQRFQSFEKSYKLLEKHSHNKNLDELQRAGIIQLFEMTFELSWKLLKDYLESQDFIVKSPRESIKQSFQIGLIENGHIWIDALENRNLTTHTYNEKIAEKLSSDITNLFLPELKKIYDKLLKEI